MTSNLRRFAGMTRNGTVLVLGAFALALLFLDGCKAFEQGVQAINSGEADPILDVVKSVGGPAGTAAVAVVKGLAYAAGALFGYDYIAKPAAKQGTRAAKATYHRVKNGKWPEKKAAADSPKAAA